MRTLIAAAWILGGVLLAMPPVPIAMVTPDLADGFEADAVGTVPQGWFVPEAVRQAGTIVEITELDPAEGRRCVRILKRGTTLFGNLMQSFDATPYRGMRVRFRASVRTEDRAQLWMRVDRADARPGFFDNMADRPIRSPTWKDFEIVGDIDEDAQAINIGIIVPGTGTAWLDSVRFQIIGESGAGNEAPRPLEQRGLVNLLAFARLLGYVRHFHPSDGAFKTDWERFAIGGIKFVEDAPDDQTLAARVRALFAPIAPTVEISLEPLELEAVPLPRLPGANSALHWEHLGFGQAAAARPGQSIYSSRRVRVPLDKAPVDDGLGPAPGASIVRDLGGIWCRVPIAVYADDDGTLPPFRGEDGLPWDTPEGWAPSYNDRATRLAAIILAWNVFQHFYPYFDVVDTDWELVLPASLKQAAEDADGDAFTVTLEQFVAQLHDGHGRVISSSRAAPYRLPVELEWVGEQLVISEVYAMDEPGGPHQGDIVLTIDGRPIAEWWAELQARISSATEQWTRYRARQELIRRVDGQPVRLELQRAGGERVAVAVQPLLDRPDLREARPRKVARLEPDIWYVDLDRITDADFTAALPDLEQARGIVFDLRGYPSQLSVLVLAHLIDEPVTCAVACPEDPLSRSRANGVPVLQLAGDAAGATADRPLRVHHRWASDQLRRDVPRDRRTLPPRRDRGRRHRRHQRQCQSRSSAGRSGHRVDRHEGAQARRQSAPRRWHPAHGSRAAHDRGHCGGAGRAAREGHRGGQGDSRRSQRAGPRVRERPLNEPVAKLSYVHRGGDTPLLGDTIDAFLAGVIARFPERDALVGIPQGARLTYRQLDEQTDRLARGLLSLGVEAGDRVGIWSTDNVEWVLLQLATARVGAVLVNINPSFRTGELRHALRQAKVQTLVLIPAFRSSHYDQMVMEVCPEAEHSEPDAFRAAELPDLRHLVIFDPLGPDERSRPAPAFRTLTEVMDGGAAIEDARLEDRRRAIDPDDPINIQFTSGTTGAPKAVVLTHHSLLNNGFFAGRAMRFSESDRLCVPVPFYHCFGMVVANLACLTHGAAIVIPADHFEAGATLAAIQNERCTAVHGVPTMFVAELEHPEFERFDLSSLRTGIMAGAPCPPELVRRVMEDMGCREILIGYGQTEASPLTHLTHAEDSLERRTETVGTNLPHQEVKIIDPATGASVPFGATGEVCFRGYHVMRGYFGQEQETRAAIDERGWLHSGDLGQLDEDGYLRITGRLKDMIIRGGENIYPAEVEAFYYEHPKVAQIAVFGVPDARLGERVGAWIKLHEGQHADPEEFRQFGRERIAHYKVPERIWFVEEFPMTVTGKIQKYRIREIVSQAMEREQHLACQGR